MFKTITNNELLKDKIVELALLQHHKEYVHGSHGLDTFDCAGLVWYVYKEILGIDIYKDGYGNSTTTKIMTSKYGTITYYEENILDKDITLINKGDILLFHRQQKQEKEPKENNKYPGHCAIYLGNNKFIHATRKSKKVVISSFDKEYWVKKLVASKKII